MIDARGVLISACLPVCLAEAQITPESQQLTSEPFHGATPPRTATMTVPLE